MTIQFIYLIENKIKYHHHHHYEGKEKKNINIIIANRKATSSCSWQAFDG